MKDLLNCPFCESEEKGVSSAWGGSPDFWEEMKARHLEKHCCHCPTCGQPIIGNPSVWFDCTIVPTDSVTTTTNIDSGTYLIWDKENPWVLD